MDTRILSNFSEYDFDYSLLVYSSLPLPLFLLFGIFLILLIYLY